MGKVDCHETRSSYKAPVGRGSASAPCRRRRHAARCRWTLAARRPAVDVGERLTHTRACVGHAGPARRRTWTELSRRPGGTGPDVPQPDIEPTATHAEQQAPALRRSRRRPKVEVTAGGSGRECVSRIAVGNDRWLSTASHRSQKRRRTPRARIRPVAVVRSAIAARSLSTGTS